MPLLTKTAFEKKKKEGAFLFAVCAMRSQGAHTAGAAFWLLLKSSILTAALFFSQFQIFDLKSSYYLLLVKIYAQEGCASSMRSKYYGLLKSMLLKSLQDFNKPSLLKSSILKEQLAFKILAGF